jgi:hypothetical protein
MHTLKIQPGASFDSTQFFFDDSILTFDSNSTGVFFSIFPYRGIGTSVTGVFKNELTRETKSIILSTELGTKNTYKIFIPLEEFTEKATYEFKLYSGSTEVYRGKLFAVFGNMQNYSVYNNENI